MTAKPMAIVGVPRVESVGTKTKVDKPQKLVAKKQ